MIPIFARVRNPHDITKLQEDNSKLIELSNKCKINFNIDKCAVTHIGHNNILGNYSMPIERFRQQIDSEI